MKISFLEFLDRTGLHVSRRLFEKYKYEKLDYSEWEYYLIYEPYRCAKETDQEILKEIGLPENFLT